MRLPIHIAAGVILVAATAFAQTRMSDAEIRQVFAGKKVEWGTYGLADYQASGVYEFTDWTQSSRVSRGNWFTSEGKMCVKFDTGRDRCDSILKDNDGYLFVNNRGVPVRGKFRN